MRTIPRVLIGLAVAFSALLAATAQAQKVTYDIRRTQNFAGLHTYTFKDAPTTTNTPEGATAYDSPLIDERIRAAVATQLEMRGFRRDDQHPDVYVVTQRTYKTEYSFYGGYGWGPWPAGFWGPYGWNTHYGIGWVGWSGWGPMYADETIVGRTTVDLQSAATGQLIWRGVAEKHVHESSKPSRRDKRINDAVEDIFKKFPTSLH
jgi:hypothetical protein